jgi:hypothetical protein
VQRIVFENVESRGSSDWEVKVMGEAKRVREARARAEAQRGTDEEEPTVYARVDGGTPKPIRRKQMVAVLGALAMLASLPQSPKEPR